MISATSVKDRLKNQATASGSAFQELLLSYGLESVQTVDVRIYCLVIAVKLANPQAATEDLGGDFGCRFRLFETILQK